MPATEAGGSPLGGAHGHVLAPRQALHAGTPMLGPALPWVFLDPKQMCVEDLGMSFSLLLCLTSKMMSSCLLYVPPEPSITPGQRYSINIG